MKVLQVSKFYPPAHGGIEAVARDLSAGLVQRGVDMAVLCAHTRREQVQETDALGVRITRAANHGMLLSTSMAPSMPGLLRRCARGVDVIHVHMPDPLAALAVWTVRPKAKVVVHWHSDVVRQRLAMHLYRPLQHWLLKRADAVIATSQDYAASSPVLRDWQDKVDVIPLGTPPPVPAAASRVSALRERHGQRRIVFALGRMTYYKGYEVLVEASRSLPGDVVVVVGGGGPDLEDYRRQAHDAGVGERIRFVGPLTAATVEAYFAAAEVFCMASTVRAEAYGVAVAEAMARGLPVVATRIPGSGLSWLHQDGVTGLAVPVRDAPALAAAIVRLLDDDELRRRFGQAGRARWAQHLTAQTMCDSTLALYRRLLGGPPAASQEHPGMPSSPPATS